MTTPTSLREEELLALNEIFMEIQRHIYEIHELPDISKKNIFILQILRTLLAQERAATEQRMRDYLQKLAWDEKDISYFVAAIFPHSKALNDLKEGK